MFGRVLFRLSFRVFFIFQIAQYVFAVPEPEPEPGLSHFAKNAFSGGVEMAKSSPLVPLQIKGAIVIGSAVVKGVDEYRKTGDIKSAGAIAANSGLNDGMNVVNGIPGAKLAMGLAKDVAAGKSMSTIISNSGKEALNIVPGVPAKELASIGLSAAQAMKDGKSIEDVVKQSAQGTLSQYAKDHPMFNQVQNLGENALNLLPQTSSQVSNGGRASEKAKENSRSSANESKSRKSRSTDSVNNQQGDCICEPVVSGLKSIRKRATTMVKRSYSKLRRTKSNRNIDNNIAQN